MNIKRFLNTDTGKTLISILLGLGLSTIFRKICKDKNCMEFYGVPTERILLKTFQYDGECFQYQPKSARCNADTKRVLPIENDGALA